MWVTPHGVSNILASLRHATPLSTSTPDSCPPTQELLPGMTNALCAIRPSVCDLLAQSLLRHPPPVPGALGTQPCRCPAYRRVTGGYGHEPPWYLHVASPPLSNCSSSFSPFTLFTCSRPCHCVRPKFRLRLLAYLLPALSRQRPLFATPSPGFQRIPLPSNCEALPKTTVPHCPLIVKRIWIGEQRQTHTIPSIIYYSAIEKILYIFRRHPKDPFLRLQRTQNWQLERFPLLNIQRSTHWPFVPLATKSTYSQPLWPRNPLAAQSTPQHYPAHLLAPSVTVIS